MPEPSQQELLARARARRQELAVGEMPAPPSSQLAILTCMDARIDPLRLFGLAVGEAHVIRNAGGLATEDAIRSLAASQRLLGTRTVAVVMHERCGLHGASEDDFARQLAAARALPGWRLGAFADLEEAVRASLARLRSAPELIHKDRIYGFVFDPASGELRAVEG